jgi:beta-ureidopropionase / N-carbamoyl-L-amino-acid hydrolase
VLELTGQPDHAGTTPMHLRHDALAAAAVLITTLEGLCRAETRAVGTIGRLEVTPNQGNVVPARVVLAVELRSLDTDLIAALWARWLEVAEQACAERGVGLAIVTQTEAPPASPPPWLLDTLLGVCRRLDAEALVLPSGAGHDTAHLSRIAPAAMLFVPSIGGRSHCPEEATDPADLELGVQALIEAVLALDAQH